MEGSEEMSLRHDEHHKEEQEEERKQMKERVNRTVKMSSVCVCDCWLLYANLHTHIRASEDTALQGGGNNERIRCRDYRRAKTQRANGDEK